MSDDMTGAPVANEPTTPEVAPAAPAAPEPAEVATAPEVPSETVTQSPGEEMPQSLLDASSGAPSNEEKPSEAGPSDGGAPDRYESFKDSEGREFTQENVGAFADVARELGLSQEKAQKIFASMAPLAQRTVQSNVVSYAKRWAEESRNDPEIGGANFGRTTAMANAAYRQFATPKLQSILNASGLSNHPEMLRLFYKVGSAISPDTGVTGGSSAPTPTRHRRYPNSNMVVDG